MLTPLQTCEQLCQQAHSQLTQLVKMEDGQQSVPQEDGTEREPQPETDQELSDRCSYIEPVAPGAGESMDPRSGRTAPSGSGNGSGAGSGGSGSGRGTLGELLGLLGATTGAAATAAAAATPMRIPTRVGSRVVGSAYPRATAALGALESSALETHPLEAATLGALDWDAIQRLAPVRPSHARSGEACPRTSPVAEAETAGAQSSAVIRQERYGIGGAAEGALVKQEPQPEEEAEEVVNPTHLGSRASALESSILGAFDSRASCGSGETTPPTPLPPAPAPAPGGLDPPVAPPGRWAGYNWSLAAAMSGPLATTTVERLLPAVPAVPATTLSGPLATTCRPCVCHCRPCVCPPEPGAAAGLVLGAAPGVSVPLAAGRPGAAGAGLVLRAMPGEAAVSGPLRLAPLVVRGVPLLAARPVAAAAGAGTTTLGALEQRQGLAQHEARRLQMQAQAAQQRAQQAQQAQRAAPAVATAAAIAPAPERLAPFYLAAGATITPTVAPLAEACTQPAAEPPGEQECWGSLFDHECGGMGGNGEKLIDKFCSVCRTTGLLVAAKRVRALLPEQYERFANSKKGGFWTDGGSGPGAMPRFRVANHTKECTGAWLVLFEKEPVGVPIKWAPMPPDWYESTASAPARTYIRLWLYKGTMMPRQPRQKRKGCTQGGPTVNELYASCTSEAALSPPPALAAAIPVLSSRQLEIDRLLARRELQVAVAFQPAPLGASMPSGSSGSFGSDSDSGSGAYSGGGGAVDIDAAAPPPVTVAISGPPSSTGAAPTGSGRNVDRVGTSLAPVITPPSAGSSNNLPVAVPLGDVLGEVLGDVLGDARSAQEQEQADRHRRARSAQEAEADFVRQYRAAHDIMRVLIETRLAKTEAPLVDAQREALTAQLRLSAASKRAFGWHSDQTKGEAAWPEAKRSEAKRSRVTAREKS